VVRNIGLGGYLTRFASRASACPSSSAPAFGVMFPPSKPAAFASLEMGFDPLINAPDAARSCGNCCPVPASDMTRGATLRAPSSGRWQRMVSVLRSSLAGVSRSVCSKRRL
jgi:hypothetical protein